jgi:hypothetical protein
MLVVDGELLELNFYEMRIFTLWLLDAKPEVCYKKENDKHWLCLLLFDIYWSPRSFLIGFGIPYFFAIAFMFVKIGYTLKN